MSPKILLCAATLALPAQGNAAEFLRANLAATNGSGVTGYINFVLDGTTLDVDLEAQGLADGVHLLHIHGLDSPAGQPVDTTPPPPPVPPNGDADKDGVVTTAEAKAAIGNVILSLAPHAAGTSGEFVGVASQGGSLSFKYSYDLTQDIYEQGHGIADLLPLDYRVFDMHGGIAPATTPANDGSTTAVGTFDPNLPIAAGAISAVPEPVGWGMMIGGLGIVGGAMRRTRRMRAGVAHA